MNARSIYLNKPNDILKVDKHFYQKKYNNKFHKSQ